MKEKYVVFQVLNIAGPKTKYMESGADRLQEALNKYGAEGYDLFQLDLMTRPADSIGRGIQDYNVVMKKKEPKP